MIIVNELKKQKENSQSPDLFVFALCTVYYEIWKLVILWHIQEKILSAFSI